jgi:hypothetical protein
MTNTTEFLAPLLQSGRKNTNSSGDTFISDSLWLSCPFCERHVCAERYALLNAKDEVSALYLDFDCCNQEEVEYNAEGECIDGRKDWDWDWRKDGSSPEDMEAAAYEDAAYGYDGYNPHTGMSEYDYDPGTSYNDAGEPVGYM